MANVFSRNNIKIIGSGNPTILFAHGFGTDQSTWKHIIDHYKDNYRIILFDNVGAGKSDIREYDPAKYSSLSGYVSDLLEIGTELDLRNAIYVGHSVSGMVGLLASIQEPDFFSKLILIGASPRYLNDKDYFGGFNQSDLDQLYHAMQTNYQEWVNGFAPAAMGNSHRPELGLEFALTLMDLRPDIALSASRGIFQSDHRKDLAEFTKPCLIIQASDDIAVPVQVGKYLHEKISGSTLINVKAKGHFPQLSAPSETISAIDSFLLSK
jgi:sigma-B regulation protein RsbQ